MESKLEALKKIVSEMFEKAEDKTTLDNLSNINNAVEEAEKEQADLVAKHAELLSSYKELVKHQAFKPTPGKQPEEPVGGEPVTFESALSNFMANIAKGE